MKYYTIRVPRFLPILIILFSLLFAASHFSPGNIFFRTYLSMRLGESKDQVVKRFGKTPEYSCQYGGTEILYFFRPWEEHVFSQHGLPQFDTVKGKSVPVPPERMPRSVEAKEDIPYVYGAAVCAFGGDGILRAYAWNGEDGIVHTVKGNVGGDNLSVLDESLFHDR